jgi:hypothetical protein
MDELGCLLLVERMSYNCDRIKMSVSLVLVLFEEDIGFMQNKLATKYHLGAKKLFLKCSLQSGIGFKQG